MSESTICSDLMEDASAPRRVVEVFWYVHFSSVMDEGNVVNSKMDGFASFSGNLYVLLAII